LSWGRKPNHIKSVFHDVVDRCSDQLQVGFTTYDDAAIWNYTSGSTGVPKAAVHLQHDVFTCLESYAKGVLGINQNDIILSASKFFLLMGWVTVFIYPAGVALR